MIGSLNIYKIILKVVNMDIYNVDSCPEYISNFLKLNMEQLMNIYDAGMSNYGTGCLSLNCNLKENKMDVFYMDIELLKKTIGDIWETIKKEDQKIFLINDIDGF